MIHVEMFTGQLTSLDSDEQPDSPEEQDGTFPACLHGPGQRGCHS